MTGRKIGIKEFMDLLWSNDVRRVYLSHYENVETARSLASTMNGGGFIVTVAEDARRFGKEFVTQKLGDSDLIIVVDPDSDAEGLILSLGSNIFEVYL